MVLQELMFLSSPNFKASRQPLTDDTPLPAVASTQLVGVDRIAERSSGVFVVLAVGASPRGWGFYPSPRGLALVVDFERKCDETPTNVSRT